MGPDGSLLDLIDKVRSWISWGASDPLYFSREFEMPVTGYKMCCECDTKFDGSAHGYDCQSCGRWFCRKCIECNRSQFPGNLSSGKGSGHSKEILKNCQYCDENIGKTRVIAGKYSKKVHPASTPRASPEPSSPSFSSERMDNESLHNDRYTCYLDARESMFSPRVLSTRNMASFSSHPAPISTGRSPSRSDEEEVEDSVETFFSPSSDYGQENSDIDSGSVSARHEFGNCKSLSSPYNSPKRSNVTPRKNEHSRQLGFEASANSESFGKETQSVLKRLELRNEDPYSTDDYSDDSSTFQNQYNKSQKPLDFENNGLIWYPPLPDDENDEAESSFFAYDDDDDDIWDSGVKFTSSSTLSSVFPLKKKPNEGTKEPLRTVVHGHFRALVSQLLSGEGIKVHDEEDDDWLDIVTTIASEAANFVKPDTSRGGSMDPGDYVKVKCIASGSPGQSALVKGVVCTKNIKHKRMTSQYKKPRLLLLEGSLEYQRVSNQLASFNTLLQQEKDHLKMIIAKIEALRPNVLLVEKSVSSYAQEYLLAKDISLVLNVKKPLLERIARCTGALTTPSIEHISTTRLGHCELFRLEKISEEHEANQFNRKTSKTLMFFEGCPRRLGCTVLLRGKCRDELKKVKHVVQYAIFAAYHLSLETSFLADEGASLPKRNLKHSVTLPERTMVDDAVSIVPNSLSQTSCLTRNETSAQDIGFTDCSLEQGGSEMMFEFIDPGQSFPSSSGTTESRNKNEIISASNIDLSYDEGLCNDSFSPRIEVKESTLSSVIGDLPQPECQENFDQEEKQIGGVNELMKSERFDEDGVASEHFAASDAHQSILVSFSSRCVLKGTVCERSRLLRIKFYGSFDKPLGRYLRNDLFDQTSPCRSCKETADAHVLCYSHQQGNLTINVRRLPSVKLPGERDGKIWMWHRCLRCANVDGVPPATRRVVMSDAAWGLSFGKFLELSFSNHATANRVATCGHSLQRDCLRFYGFGSMVAFFRYSPIDILSVQLPPSILDFSAHNQRQWIRTEAGELMDKMETMFAEISDVLDNMEKITQAEQELSDVTELLNTILELKDQLGKEMHEYNGLLHPVVMGTSRPNQMAFDILELNQLRRTLMIGSLAWDRQLYSFDCLLKKTSISKTVQWNASYSQMNKMKSDSFLKYNKADCSIENASESSGSQESPRSNSKQDFNLQIAKPYTPADCKSTTGNHKIEDDASTDGQITATTKCPSPASSLYERIDSLWTGTDQVANRVQPLRSSQVDVVTGDVSPLRRLMAPVRVQSFDSAVRIQERIRKGLPPSSLYLSTLRSFHASGDYRNMVRDPVSNMMRNYSQILPLEAQKLSSALTSRPSFISSASNLAEGARLLLPQRGYNNIVIAVYDNDYSSIISYALSSKDYEDWVADDREVGWNFKDRNRDSTASTLSAWQSFGSPDLDYINYGGYGSEDGLSSIGSLLKDAKNSPHPTISFSDDSSTAGGKVLFSVTCYFAKQFDVLRKKCCPSEVDFLRSFSRCQRWSAQGGKSNVYFAKSLDERFIIKQVKKTELESFEEFAPEYFKYLSDSLNSGSPTCLAKILGIYQVSVKHLKGGKETKMDLMVMENLFFGRNVSKVYDLKGSARSRYNADTKGANKVQLDMNLLETLRTDPIFLGSKAKRSLERAIWNDTYFLASVDVMDYSLLVGVDEERKELVLGIIDFMRQYTWDKHLETWVKASGILGGPKNAAPTIVSPKQYKKRFRKAMTSYFLTVPDQWSL